MAKSFSAPSSSRDHVLQRLDDEDRAIKERLESENRIRPLTQIATIFVTHIATICVPILLVFTAWAVTNSFVEFFALCFFGLVVIPYAAIQREIRLNNRDGDDDDDRVIEMYWF